MKRALALIFFLPTAFAQKVFQYQILPEGAPATFISDVKQAIKTWQDVPKTGLKIEESLNQGTTFIWGSGDIKLNPDAISRTLITTGDNGSTTEVRINPALADFEVALPSILLTEVGLRLGLKLEPTFAIKEERKVGETEIQLLRTTYPIGGDLNSDGVVDINDLEIMAGEFGKQTKAGSTPSRSDINGDGIVNETDLKLLQENYIFEPETKTEPVKTSNQSTTVVPTTPNNDAPIFEEPDETEMGQDLG